MTGRANSERDEPGRSPPEADDGAAASPEGAPVRVRPLTDAEREELIRWVKSDETAQGPRRRARVVLLSSYGISTYVIALLIPIGRNNAAHWIRRFNEEGLAGLVDRPRPGRPRRG